jgi:leader peptidase (prepilin peptidase)/N-methyltransferase
MTDAATLILTALLGLCVGSFLNVCIYRLPRRQSLVSPPSRCPRCNRRLAWFDNIPVLSWVLLRGTCRQCQAPISKQYPIVELVTAALSLGVVAATPPGPLLASRLVLLTMLIVLFVIDLEHQILPDAITLPGIGVGLAFSLFAPPGVLAAIVGTIVGAAGLEAIRYAYYLWRREEGMGFGDVKMLAMIGAFLGWKAVILTVVLSSFAGALVGVSMMSFKREGLKYALPFGTFLAVGAIVAMLAGDPIIDWYVSLYEPR